MTTEPRSARTWPIPLLATLLACALGACGQTPDGPNPPPPPGQLKVTMEEVASGLQHPVAITNAGDERLFVVERGGTIRVVSRGAVLSAPFLDLSALVTTGGERGLLGLAFAPDYATSGRFYVDYTDLSGATVVARYRVSSDPDVADPASREDLLTFPRSTEYHNGGQLAFGPADGFLYVSSGDGGEGGDESGALDNLLGKILRLDVAGAAGYAVPASNPFVGVQGAAPEIWAYGLRNPWRFSFDRKTGDLYIADVGESAFEEVDFQSATSEGGENYGWNVMEGDACYAAPGCDRTGLVAPVMVYPHGPSTGSSITGGYVYRGSAIPKLVGRYVFGDFVSGNVWQSPTPTGWKRTQLLATGKQLTAFGEDVAGELYLADYGGGVIYRVAP